jgi:hypothetical protein
MLLESFLEGEVCSFVLLLGIITGICSEWISVI